MQALHDAELENWHDFEVGSRREIVVLLRQIGEHKQLIRMKIKGEGDVCVTSVLDVDDDEGRFVLDRSIDPDQNRRILAASGLTCETYLDKIRILFSIDKVQEVEYEGGPALVADIPATLFRLQRREFYRMATPLTTPVPALLPMPLELGGGNATFPLADISCGGVALLDNRMVLNSTMGQTFTGCRIELPEIGTVTTSLQVRNALDVTMLNNKTSRRIGCMFVDISRANAAAVQRYITKLERERNARLRG
ncbi:flagellar brake protein [Massilia sp. Dwa41.01b]|uniref:flagellar brake protein n=1 Tax=unclassified Massilia TaxID=2609279 RepID=UPI0016012D1C|nr:MULTISPECIES: flagellar brake protein [unclassified Massilia]QNA90069.1 flagellar brake protein [Massilia sp. Dwa41.01b]QNB00959.1 flagellar brake protein [Massilia sp. Se16.2.3]